jgi:hypothetical protein
MIKVSAAVQTPYVVRAPMNAAMKLRHCEAQIKTCMHLAADLGGWHGTSSFLASETQRIDTHITYTGAAWVYSEAAVPRAGSR